MVTYIDSTSWGTLRTKLQGYLQLQNKMPMAILSIPSCLNGTK